MLPQWKHNWRPRCPCVVHALWALSIVHPKRGETWRNMDWVDALRCQVAKWPSSVYWRIDEWVVTLVLWGNHDSAMTQALERNATGPSGGPGSLLLFTEVFTCVYYHLTYHLLIYRLSFVCEQRYKANEIHAKHLCSMQMMEPMTDTLTFKHVLSKTASKTLIEFYRIFWKT